MAERRNVKNISSRPHFSSKRAQADITAAAEAFADGHVLAGLLVHEFNNLLTPIIGYAEMAADALRSGSSSRMYVERIRDACDRAKRAVERILMSDMGDEDSVASTPQRPSERSSQTCIYAFRLLVGFKPIFPIARSG